MKLEVYGSISNKNIPPIAWFWDSFIAADNINREISISNLKISGILLHWLLL